MKLVEVQRYGLVFEILMVQFGLLFSFTFAA